ncbi:MAG: hypothetical protein LWX56_10300 [Ignavibacteria bacterium]|nr:hypothetical protein [Ignavibacteria bacterium]
MTKRFTFLIVFLILCATIISAQEIKNRHIPEWLIGNWIGTGSGAPGFGTGEFSFSYELDSMVIIRKAHSTYPSRTEGKMLTHDDLLVVYKENDVFCKAHYYDNEGHIIEYTISIPDTGNAVIFTSNAPAGQPIFRLTYIAYANQQVFIEFAISPTQTPAQFRPYVSGFARRKY